MNNDYWLSQDLFEEKSLQGTPFQRSAEEQSNN
jgi:hypothetical protein